MKTSTRPQTNTRTRLTWHHISMDAPTGAPASLEVVTPALAKHASVDVDLLGIVGGAVQGLVRGPKDDVVAAARAGAHALRRGATRAGIRQSTRARRWHVSEELRTDGYRNAVRAVLDDDTCDDHLTQATQGILEARLERRHVGDEDLVRLRALDQPQLVAQLVEYATGAQRLGIGMPLLAPHSFRVASMESPPMDESKWFELIELGGPGVFDDAASALIASVSCATRRYLPAHLVCPVADLPAILNQHIVLLQTSSSYADYACDLVHAALDSETHRTRRLRQQRPFRDVLI